MAEHVLYRCNKCGSYAEPPLAQAFCYCLGTAEWVQGVWLSGGTTVTNPVMTKTWMCTMTMDVDNFVTENGVYPVDPVFRINAGSWYRATLVDDKVTIEEIRD